MKKEWRVLFKNNVTGEIYIGSAKNIYHRYMEHITGEKTNVRLWRSLQKYGINNFSFMVIEFAPYVVPNITDTETIYISKYPNHLLFNFKKIATSIEGYTHTEEAKQKMRDRFFNKENHPMYNKHHTPEALLLISKPGELNPMFGKSHSVETRSKISERMSGGSVRCYDINIKPVHSFFNNVKAAEHFKVSKVTIGKYISTKQLFIDQYYLQKK